MATQNQSLGHLRTIRQRTNMSSPSDTPPSSPGSDFIPPEDPILSERPWHPSQRPLKKSRHSRYIVCAVFGVAVIVISATLLALRDRIYVASLRRSGIPAGLWSKDGILYAGNEPFAIKGLSWFGMEEPAKVPGGLMQIALPDVFSFITRYNFNAIRIPLAVDNILENGYPHGGISTFRNPQLLVLNYFQLLRYVIRKAASRNVLVLLDVHRLKNDDTPNRSNGFWHSPEVPEDRLFSAWKILCETFGNEWNVMGADLFNEPHNATWGSNDPLDDWKRTSERLSEAIHQACPSWLAVIEGVGNAEKSKETAFWAENLNPMYSRPPDVTLSQKVALSPHVYGPSVFMQTYFEHVNFTEGMPSIWDDHFGLASEKTGFATIVGEWGGKYAGKDREWQQKFLQYLNEKKMSSFYWSLNPDSEDTGGLLRDGWAVPEHEKLALLDSLPSSGVEDYAIHFKYWRNWRTQ